tara:strand:- start:10510 stop:11805 length:1296 start_codon:yes stop_codon:yes gene_type:complete
MKIFFALALFAIISYLFLKRNISGVILLITLALVKYEIILGGKPVAIYQLITLFLTFIFFFFKPKSLIYDKRLFFSVLMFIAGLSFAALVMRPEGSILGRLQLCFDYSFLFFATIFCLKDIEDLEKLIKGIHFGIFLVATIGTVGLIIGNPFFGLQEIDGKLISTNYFENISYYNKTINGNYISENRIRYSTSDPNSLGILMNFGLLISISLMKKNKLKMERYFNYFCFALFSFTILLTLSRTSYVLLLLILLFNFFNRYFLLYAVLFTALTYLSIETLSFLDLTDFFTKRLNTEESNIYSGNNRLERWSYHFNNLSLEYLLFGNSYTGYQGTSTTMSHNNFLALIYRGGLFAFFSFFYILCRMFFSKKTNGFFPFRQLSIIIVIAGLSQELVNSYGPNFIIWPLIAALAFYSKIFNYNNELSNSGTADML